jgi:cation:H+ antiporter
LCIIGDFYTTFARKLKMDYFFLIVGIAILLFSGDWLVKAGSNLAKHFKIHPFIIGVTIISFGTSAPELFVSLGASISGNPDIALGNIIGSNIANIGLVLGITSLIITIPISKQAMKFDYSIMLISTIIFTAFMFNGTLSRIEGIILLLIMAAYICILTRKARKSPHIEQNDYPKPLPTSVSLIIIPLACAGLALGANWLVKGASNIAASINVSERIISITVIALGTSLPELVTSVIAAVKNHLDISIGNIIGSNIFNILSIGGISALVNPLNINTQTLNFDIYFFIGFAILLGLSFFPIKNSGINKLKGFVMLIGYATYCFLLFY